MSRRAKTDEVESFFIRFCPIRFESTRTISGNQGAFFEKQGARVYLGTPRHTLASLVHLSSLMSG